MKVPEQFMQNMQTLLGDSYSSYEASFSMPNCRGLRVNTLREQAAERILQAGLAGEEIPFVQNGYYIHDDVSPAKHPFHAAGLYYLQEPSAMLPADRLPVKPGDLVLDLCAAPGGKSTQLAAKLKGEGILFANDLSANRAKTLMKNLVLAGVSNCFVSAMDPKDLAAIYGPVFDKILVDAPCSGEGMFRKDPLLIKDWEQKGPAYYAPIQREILSAAVKMLKCGGYLMYSTCTFSLTENEENILWLLEQYPELSPVQIELTDGMSEGFLGLKEAARCFPHRMKAEGHFLTLLKKQGDRAEETNDRTAVLKPKKLPSGVLDLCKRITKPVAPERILERDNLLYLLPEGYEKLYRSQIRYIRTGLLLGGTDRNGNLKPDQALAMWLSSRDFDQTVSFRVEDERVFRYLRGETIILTEEESGEGNGIVLVCVDDYPLGFAKKDQSKLKNMINPGFIRH